MQGEKELAAKGWGGVGSVERSRTRGRCRVGSDSDFRSTRLLEFHAILKHCFNRLLGPIFALQLRNFPLFPLYILPRNCPYSKATSEPR